MNLQLTAIVRRPRPATRGQAMVEFALVLPILALLLVLALDFGRVFFGWVGIHNVARIAANHAASHPEYWEPPGNSSGQDTYRDAVIHDLQAINCAPTGGGSWTTGDIPDPVFEDMPTSFSSSNAYELGDHAAATVECEFTFITPIAALIMGNPLDISATAEFPVRAGYVDGVPIGGELPPPSCDDAVVPTLIGLSVQGARDAWTAAGFTGAFFPALGLDTETVTSQNTTPASNPGDCLTVLATVTVTSTPPGGCPAGQFEVPNLVGLTVASARTEWTDAGFTGAFSPASGSDSNVVTAQLTVPVSNPGDCKLAATTVTVTHGPPLPTPEPQCTAPQLIGVNVTQGQTNFTAAGFGGSYTITRPPNGNYNIKSQSLVGGQSYPCSSSITVAGN